MNGVAGTLRDVDVLTSISHTWNGELDIELRHTPPGGGSLKTVRFATSVPPNRGGSDGFFGDALGRLGPRGRLRPGLDHERPEAQPRPRGRHGRPHRRQPQRDVEPSREGHRRPSARRTRARSTTGPWTSRPAPRRPARPPSRISPGRPARRSLTPEAARSSRPFRCPVRRATSATSTCGRRSPTSSRRATSGQADLAGGYDGLDQQPARQRVAELTHDALGRLRAGTLITDALLDRRPDTTLARARGGARCLHRREPQRALDAHRHRRRPPARPAPSAAGAWTSGPPPAARRAPGAGGTPPGIGLPVAPSAPRSTWRRRSSAPSGASGATSRGSR